MYSKPSSGYATTSCSESTPVYGKPSSSFDIPSYTVRVPTCSAPIHSKSSKSIYTTTYTPLQYIKSTSAYGEPSKSNYTPTYQTPSHHKSTPTYSTPSSSSIPQAYIVSKYTPAYSASSYSTPSYLPPYTSPPYRTTYATHTITKTSPYIIKTVTVSAGTGYHSPSSWYSAPTYSIPYYEQPGFTHTPQQEPQILSNWYNRPTNSSVYVALTPSSQYYESSASEYTAPTPVFSQPWFDPPLSMPPADMHTNIRNGFENH
jgi:hypothetical protein